MWLRMTSCLYISSVGIMDYSHYTSLKEDFWWQLCIQDVSFQTWLIIVDVIMIESGSFVSRCSSVPNFLWLALSLLQLLVRGGYIIILVTVTRTVL